MEQSTGLNKMALSCFRTKQCVHYLRGNCNFTDSKCLYSHQSICVRRCPFYLSDTSYIRYLPLLCRNVVFGPKFEVIEMNCPHGNECVFSHCIDELLYHPNFYKIIPCKDHLLGFCGQGYCPFVHDKSEQRALRHYKLPFAKGVKIPHIKHITVVDRIVRKKPRTDARKPNKPSRAPFISRASTCSGPKEESDCFDEHLNRLLMNMRLTPLQGPTRQDTDVWNGLIDF
ncbi:hypothetical protein BBBOND_0102050 [Babesia bigemina]|uniref:C3H1-type domain-containing protein n=1 Tax=Babesia bigemina TaxID=5866 RepID=A0A061CZ27_BABBI|nr:hypothetical protein BBBOND_0102050 [Babesia bigemina]CDR93876.1 hypothetical protein BBBOND_0102050 [Babesia bigemina]|eukprot:XP_012766062.1 hypothetical protein BBBOND_0102050 [Babesia bigemina]